MYDISVEKLFCLMCICLSTSFAFMPGHGFLTCFIKLVMTQSWEMLQHLLMVSSPPTCEKKNF